MSKNLKRRIFHMTVLIMPLSFIVGCAAMHSGDATSDYTIEPVSPAHVVIENFRLYEVKGGIRISGELHPRGRIRISPTGRINVQVIDQKDIVVEEVSNHYHRVGKINRPDHRYKFSVMIPAIPPAGSTIRIKYDDTQS